MLTKNQPQSALESPVAASELADYLGIPYDAGMMAGNMNAVLLTACELVISHTGHELLEREHLYTVRQGYVHLRFNVYPVYLSETGIITLPIWPVTEVLEVTEDDEAVDIDANIDTMPAQVVAIGDVVTIRYTAGYPTASDIPSTIITAIKQVAGYLYENRGCNAMDAVKDSGAAMLLATQRNVVTL